MNSPYEIVDLFAGPGGLAEGFAAAGRTPRGRIYRIGLSIEKEASAYRTLLLRTFTRQFPAGKLPDLYYAFARGDCSLDELTSAHSPEWEAAIHEAVLLELGAPGAWERLRPSLDAVARRSPDRTVVIGGPPCQAYSLVGRARNAGIEGYRAENDHRHFLYREYIRIIDHLRPAAFVMENVKGLLSSSVAGQRMFRLVLSDLESAAASRGGYRLFALAPNESANGDLLSTPEPRDFIMRAEQFGVPQARHRVFVIGIRGDLADRLSGDMSEHRLEPSERRATVRDVLGGMPALRSGLSRGDSEAKWRESVRGAMRMVADALEQPTNEPMARIGTAVRKIRRRFDEMNHPLSRRNSSPGASREFPAELNDLHEFIVDPRLDFLPQHESRGHMPSDLARYFFCAVFAQETGRSAKAPDFPSELAPDHASWSTGKFTDRFRVQRWDAPSTTITSHIAKDGHYFIHPDPLQCRSLTVREAARLQTFPDNYLFMGNRTQQYVQVGNAVPPFLARQIGIALRRLLP